MSEINKAGFINSFEGCTAKVVRCRELIVELKNDIDTLMLTRAIKVVGCDQPDRSRYAFWVEGPQIPLKISVIAGEILHHLRSVLDHIVWGLSLKKTASPRARIQFPISDTREKFQEAIRRDLADVPEAAITIIEAIQPYNADPIEHSTFRILNAMNNADKHRLLTVVSTAMRPDRQLSVKALGPDFSIILPEAKEGATIFHHGLENGVEIQWVAYDDPGKFGVEMKNDFTVEITFNEVGSRAKQPVIQTLTNLCDAIEAYISHFDIFFAEKSGDN